MTGPATEHHRAAVTERHEVVVVGGGQAGLAIGHFLKQQGRDFTILEAADTPAAAWRERWDSLRLFTPGRRNGLPGRPFPGDPDRYPGRDEVVAYLTDYARDLDLPLRDEGPGHRRAEQILSVVDRARAQRREDEIADELLAEVLDVALLGAGGDRLLADAPQLLTILSDVSGDADDACVVVLTQPGDNDRRVETTGVGEDDGARHGCS